MSSPVERFIYYSISGFITDYNNNEVSKVDQGARFIRRIDVRINDVCLPTILNSNKALSYLMLSHRILSWESKIIQYDLIASLNFSHGHFTELFYFLKLSDVGSFLAMLIIVSNIPLVNLCVLVPNY